MRRKKGGVPYANARRNMLRRIHVRIYILLLDWLVISKLILGMLIRGVKKILLYLCGTTDYLLCNQEGDTHLCGYFLQDLLSTGWDEDLDDNKSILGLSC